ncbi:MAG: FISUMP domain-containing protein [Candidatus Cloacimonetes bacterium]|nr:FISUMP domain-containing protein [Candidatus Cloacimonadota bacterium]
MKAKNNFYIKHHPLKCNSLVLLLIVIFAISCDVKEPNSPYHSSYNMGNMTGELSITALSDSSVKLQWQENSKVVGSYLIERRTDSDEHFLPHAEVEANKSEFTDTGLLTTNRYYYRVTGRNDQNHTKTSLENNVQTIFDPIENLTIIQETIHSASLSWEHDCDYETGYVIERRETGKYFSGIGEGEETRNNTEGNIEADLTSSTRSATAVSGQGVKNAPDNRRTENQKTITPSVPQSGIEELPPRKLMNGESRVSLSKGDVPNSRDRGLRDFTILTTLNPNTTSFLDDSILPNRQYEYRVKAVTEYNESNPLSAQITMDFPAPGNLTITQNNVHTFTLNWQDNSNGENGFRIERKIDGENFSVIHHTAENTIGYIDNINIRNTYNTVYYRVCAFYGNDPIELSPAASNQKTITFSPVQNLNFEKLLLNKIRLTWTDINNGEEGFRIQKQVDNSSWEELGTTTALFFEDSNAEINQNLRYRVAPFSGNNLVDYRTTPLIDNAIPAPEELSYVRLTLHNIRLDWQEDITGEQGFKIDKKVGTDSWFTVYDSVAANLTTWTDTNAEIGQNLQYRVYSYYEEFNSLFSNTVAIDNSIPAPTNLVYSRPDIISVQLSWQQSMEGIESFRIDKKNENSEWEENYAMLDANIYSWTDSSAEINETIYYRIYSCWGTQLSSPVNTPPIDTAIPSPTNISYEVISINSIRLSWQENINGETGFRIDKVIDYDTGAETIIGYAYLPANSTTWIDTDVGLNLTIRYEVSAYYEDHFSELLPTEDIYLNVPPPSNLTYSRPNIHTIQLEWQENINGEHGFKIDKKVGENDWITAYAIVNENETTWTDSEAEVNQNLQYKVYAYYEDENSVMLTTEIIDNILPAPTNLTYSQPNIHSVQLEWQEDINGEHGFKIDKKVGDGDWIIPFDSVAENVSTWTDSEAEVNQNLQYRIYACYEDDNSLMLTTEIIDNTLPVPLNFNYVIQNNNNVLLTWNYPSLGIDGFSLERRIENGNWSLLADNIPADIMNYFDIDLDQDTIYSYRLNALYNIYSSSFTDSLLVEIPIYYVTDIDGNIYQVVRIGNQYWMAENLKVTRYRNGDQIPHVTDNSTWTSTTSGAYCVYNNAPSNADTYGNLFNWYAVVDTRDLAPEGWRVPSDDDIKELEMSLGMSQEEVDNSGNRGTNEGSKLAGRADLWTDGNLENDPEFGSSGFNFLPCGFRSGLDGSFHSMAYIGGFWSSTEGGSDYAWGRRLSYDGTRVDRGHGSKTAGFSVRCVKDLDN